MTGLTPSQALQTVGIDLGGTQRPSGELGWGRLALFERGENRREESNFHQLSRLMGEAEMDSMGFANPKVGGPCDRDRNLSSVISLYQRMGSIVNQVGGLEFTTTPIFSKPNGKVVFIDQEVPGGTD